MGLSYAIHGNLAPHHYLAPLAIFICWAFLFFFFFSRDRKSTRLNSSHERRSRMPSMGTTCQPCTHIHGNPARLCPWEPRTTPLFSTISNIPLLGFSFLSFFSRIFVCRPFRLSLSPLGMDHEHITTFAAHHHGL